MMQMDYMNNLPGTSQLTIDELQRRLEQPQTQLDLSQREAFAS